MTTLQTAAQQALDYMKSVGQMDMHPEEWAIVGRLEAALVEDAMQKFTDVNQEIEAALAEPDPFSPDWDRIEPLQENLREHMAEIKRLRAALAEPVQEPVAYAVSRTLHWHEGKGVNDAQLYLAAPTQRKPLRTVTYVCPVCAASLERKE